jgi:pimeloyl-ACP methyl ester carboxylesterase
VIDGQPVHFMHVRSPEPNALPLVITHGWPGSIAEFTTIIGPLTNPRAHGGNPADAFDVVCPSIPGYGFSGPTTEPGWDTARVAAAWAQLMARLGYERYGAQGGDFGSLISRDLALHDPDHVVSIHLNMVSAGPPPDFDFTTLTDKERAGLAGLERYWQSEAGYIRTTNVVLPLERRDRTAVALGLAPPRCHRAERLHVRRTGRSGVGCSTSPAFDKRDCRGARAVQMLPTKSGGFPFGEEEFLVVGSFLTARD